MQQAKDLLLCSFNVLVLISTAGAQLIAESPVTATVALGMNATFSCRGDNNITWEVNGLQIRGHTQVDNLRAHKVYVPLPKLNFSELIITATNITNYTSVVCIVGPSNSIGDNAVKSNEARLLVYGEPYPPYDLNIVVKDLSLVATWSEPFSLQGEELSYVISISGMDDEITVNMANYTLTKQAGLHDCTQYQFTVYSKNAFSKSINGISRRENFPAVPLVLQHNNIGINVLLNRGICVKITFNSSADPCPSYPVSSYKFHITNWYTNRLINITTHPNGENPFILDGSDGLIPDQVYSLVIEAVNSVGSTLSEETMFYTTGLQPAATTVMELNGSIIVTCTFAMGASSTGCQVTILTMDTLQEVLSTRIIRPHGFSEVEGTVDISGLVGDSSLLVQVAELRSGGGVSRVLLNRTVNVNVPYLSMQENKGDGILPWILGVAVVMGVIVIILIAALIIIFIYCSHRMKSSRRAKTELDPDYELTPNDTYGISIEITPEESSQIHADGIKPIPNTVYGVSQGGDHLMQEVCSKLDEGDGMSVLSAYVTMEPNVYDTIKQI